MSRTRRSFLKAASCLGGSLSLHGGLVARSMTALGALAAQSSQAATADYKAIVCLFMHGGADTHNWIVPTDADGYREYAAARRELAVADTRLRTVAASSLASGRSIGMPEELDGLRKWYESGHAAIVANIGTLERPTTRKDFTDGLNLPHKLFSHNDQASTWQSLSPEGARSGWGGRFADLLLSQNGKPIFTAVSATGNSVFLAGNTATQYQVSTEGPIVVRGLQSNSMFGSSQIASSLRKVIVPAGVSEPFAAEYGRVVQRSIDNAVVLRDALAGTSVLAVPDVSIQLGQGGTVSLRDDSLAKQLRAVAQMIAAAPTLGLRRQVFMVSMSGFDSHANEMRDQPSLMKRAALSIDYFMTAMSNLGLLDKVALFTASDFGRTLSTNGNGSDHGWGSHHFVLGGGVRGGNVHGSFPITSFGTDTDVGSGRLLPTTGVTELAASLGRWFGVSDSNLAYALPNVGAFTPRRLALFG